METWLVELGSCGPGARIVRLPTLGEHQILALQGRKKIDKLSSPDLGLKMRRLLTKIRNEKR